MKGCKKCPAFAKCTVTYRSSGCEALRWTYGIDTDPEIITNADRIRGMSDEELAKMFNDWQVIRHQLYLDSENKNTWRVDSMTPIQWGPEPMPNIEKI